MTVSPTRHPVMYRLVIAVSAALFSQAVLVGGCGEAEAVSAIAVDAPQAPDLSLEAALVQGDDNAVRAHIMAGTPVNLRNMTGDSPLHIAAALGRVYAVEVLIGAGAELETTNSSGATPLFNAAFFCHADALQALIDAGANRAVTDQHGTSIRQIMEMPWEQIRPIYEMVHTAIGLPFDEQRIQRARPEIAAMLH